MHSQYKKNHDAILTKKIFYYQTCLFSPNFPFMFFSLKSFFYLAWFTKAIEQEEDKAGRENKTKTGN